MEHVQPDLKLCTNTATTHTLLLLKRAEPQDQVLQNSPRRRRSGDEAIPREEPEEMEGRSRKTKEKKKK